MAVLAAHHGVLDLSLAPNITSNSSTANTTFASWNMVSNAVRYNVTLTWPDLTNTSQETNDTNVTFENLVPATTYTLTVQGVDPLDRNGDPATVNITTARTGELTGVHAFALHEKYLVGVHCCVRYMDSKINEL